MIIDFKPKLFPTPWLLMLLSALLIVITPGCKKFLDVDPPISKIPTAEVFADDVTANSAVAGMYIQLYQGNFGSSGINSMAWLAGLSADELHNNLQADPGVTTFEKNELEAINSHVGDVWAAMYKTIYQANAIIEGVKKSSGMTGAKKNEFTGEAYFVRAFTYFYLVNLFGDVPLALETDYTSTSKLSRSPVEAVYDQVEQDLLKAEQLLQETYPTTGRVRPNKFAVDALLSRVYLYRGKWGKAEEKSTVIIQRTDLYNLPVLSTVFLSNSTEAIWQLKPTDLAFFTNEYGAYNQQYALNNNVLTNKIGLLFSDVDKRKQNWIQVLGAGPSTVFLPLKYKAVTAPGQSLNEYSTVFRLAEQHLIRAEARAHLGNISGTNSAITDVNLVRSRAGLPDTTANDLEGVMGIVEQERAMELFTEWGHRWFDLKRWDKATLTLSPLKPGWASTDLLYPIPQGEINKDPHLKPQNPGY